MELTDLASELRQKVISFALSTHNLTSSPQICPCLSQDPATECSYTERVLASGHRSRNLTKPTRTKIFSCPPIFLTNRLLSTDAIQVLRHAPRRVTVRVCSAACLEKSLQSCSEETLDRIASISFEHRLPEHGRRDLYSQKDFVVHILNIFRSCRETFRTLDEFFDMENSDDYNTDRLAQKIEGIAGVKWYVRKWAVKRPEGRRYT